jgi:DNA-binding transcriptional LysR family regulator
MPGIVPAPVVWQRHPLPVLIDERSLYWGVDLGLSLRDIGCYVVVADRLSFSRAAATLGMSQPAVSQAIARLEGALGLRLFERTSREVQLTHAGKLLLPYAEALLEHASGFSAEATRLAIPAGGAIRLAYCPMVGTLAARVARRLAGRSPGIEVELRAAGWSAATADLAQGAASAALMSTPFPAGFATTARFQVPVGHVAVPAGSPLATASRLAGRQLARVLLPRNRPPGSLWAQLSTRLPAAGTTTVDDLDDLPAALDLVAAGRGVLPAPRLLVETVRRPDVRFIPLDVPGLRMSYGLVWRDHERAELMALVQAAQEVMRA